MTVKPHLYLTKPGTWKCLYVTFGGRVIRGLGSTPAHAYNDMMQRLAKVQP